MAFYRWATGGNPFFQYARIPADSAADSQRARHPARIAKAVNGSARQSKPFCGFFHG